MRDYGVTYKSVPLMYDSFSAICLAHNPVFHGSAKHIKVRHHFLRDHVEKGGIENKYKLVFLSILVVLLLCEGSLVFAIPMAWFEGELVICLIHLYLLLFSCIFFIVT
jgi:hypothetical protein